MLLAHVLWHQALRVVVEDFYGQRYLAADDGILVPLLSLDELLQHVERSTVGHEFVDELPDVGIPSSDAVLLAGHLILALLSLSVLLESITEFLINECLQIFVWLL